MAMTAGVRLVAVAAARRAAWVSSNASPSSTYELEHLERGHVGCQPAAVEALVEAAAAHNLVPLTAVAEAIVWACCEAELAADLWVDTAMVRTRLATPTVEEQAYIDDVIARREAAL